MPKVMVGIKHRMGDGTVLSVIHTVTIGTTHNNNGRYRSDTISSNTANSKFLFIRSPTLFEVSVKILPDSYHFMFKMHG